MLNLLKSALLGTLEGLTEFVPVSSTGHLILGSRLLGLDAGFSEIFTIFIQSGAMLAVVTLYRRTFAEICFPRFRDRRRAVSPLLPRLVLTTLPGLVVGPLAHHAIIGRLFQPRAVAAGLIAGGIWIILQEKLSGRRARREMDQLSLRDALVIGLFQCLAMWPGISRAAASIMGAMLCGLSRRAAAQYSFLAAVPIIAAASAYDLLQQPTVGPGETLWLAAGFLSAYLTALLTLRLFLRWISRHTYLPFAVYRFAVGGLALLIR
ncbi:MAG TPA: undecaprenyl-diphosphate phosphatase [Kiritimatiellae bacterium]|nr:undecaprenyl-diphosphate phosphatase [Kiritimatiellia bacterium]